MTLCAIDRLLVVRSPRFLLLPSQAMPQDGLAVCYSVLGVLCSNYDVISFTEKGHDTNQNVFCSTLGDLHLTHNFPPCPFFTLSFNTQQQFYKKNQLKQVKSETKKIYELNTIMGKLFKFGKQ